MLDITSAENGQQKRRKHKQNAHCRFQPLFTGNQPSFYYSDDGFIAVLGKLAGVKQ